MKRAAILEIDTSLLSGILKLPKGVKVQHVGVDYSRYNWPMLEIHVLDERGLNLPVGCEIEEGERLKRCLINLRRDHNGAEYFEGFSLNEY